jgi:hypothetical protein
VRKYDPSGTLLWTRQFGTSGNDSAFDLVADETGVLVAGSVSVGGAPSSPTDAFVRKYDASGEEVWTVQFGTPAADEATAIALTAGGFCVAGWTAGALHGQTSNGGEDAFVCKCDAAGNFVWTRLLGGTMNDRASGLSVYDGDTFLATSEGFRAGSGVATGGGGFLARYDANGFAQWTRDVSAHGIDVNAGGIYACATGYSPRYLTDSVRLRRYGLDGLEDWVTEEPVYGSFFFWDDDLTAQAITAVGSRIYVAGGVSGSLRSEAGLGIQEDTFVLQFDNLGHPGWTYRVDHGGEDYARSIAYDDDRLFVAGARAVNNSGNPFAGSGNSYVATLQLGIGPVDSTPPVADAGMDQSIHVGVPVQLDGTGSSDDTSPSEALVYDWELVAEPMPGSRVTTFFRGPILSFFPNDPGEFRFRLVVTDEQGNRSQPDEVVVSSLNLAPTADAGPDQIVLVGTQTAVDGLASYDPDQDSVTYAWTIVSAPAGSAALLAGFSAWRSLQPDLPGSYVLQLVVSDAWSSSVPDSMTIVAVMPTEFAQIKLQQACAQLHAMTAASFDAPGHQESLCNQLAQIVNFIQMPNLAQAQAHLTQAIARVDGWSLRNAFDPKGQGQPHAADFVVTDAEQRAVWVLLTDSLALLQQ